MKTSSTNEALAQSSLRLAGVGVFTWDQATGTVWWSDELFRIAERELAKGQPTAAERSAFGQTMALAPLRRAMADVLQTLAPASADLELRRPDGRPWWLHVRAEAIVDGEGRATGLRGTVIDLTAHRQADRQKLDEVEHLAGVGSWEWDPATNSTIWSEQLFRTYGRDPSAGPPTFEGFVPYHEPRAFEQLGQLVQRALTSGEPYEQDTFFTRRDGSTAWVTGRGEVVRDPSGSVVRLRGTTLDITARKEAELTLSRSQRELQEATRLARIGSWDWTVATDAVTWSEGLRTLLGWPLDGPAPTLEAQEPLFTPESWARLNGLVSRALTTGEPYETDLELSKRPSGVRWISARGEPVRGPDGAVIGLHGTIADITNRKHLEEQVVHLQKMESVGRLAGGVAHDFNNMLTLIMGHTEYALDVLGSPGSEVDEVLREVLVATRRSATLTRQLLAFSRRGTVEPQVLALNDTVASAITMLRRVVGESIELAWLPGEGVWPVKMDPSQVHNLITNLVVNAKDAIVGHGQVTIATDNATLDEAFCARHPGLTPGDYVSMTVRDTGGGISPDALARIFEPFFTTKGVGQGTGLGLAIVYSIVQQAGGHVLVESEQGKGATFRFWFPRQHVEGAAPGLPGLDAVPRGVEHVLLVEDESAVLSMSRAILTRLGYRVSTAGSPMQALELFRDHRDGIDLLITDVVMPEMSGRQLSRALTSMKPGLKVLYVSGYTADILEQSGVAEGASHLLHKPFSHVQLGQAVRLALEGRVFTTPVPFRP